MSDGGPPLGHSWSLDDLFQACRNVGLDLSCARCAAAFFTGVDLGERHDPDCRTAPCRRGSCGVSLQLSSFMESTFQDMLARFADVRVGFVRHESLAVPESVVPAEGAVQVLSYGLGMPVPILDLATSSEGISATLSFNHSPVATFVPWEAVVGIRGYGELPASPVDAPRPRLTAVP